MGAPHGAQGNQKQHTEKPLKVYAEQYVEGAPLPVGAVIFNTDFRSADPPPPYTDGVPRVLLPTGPKILNLTDWVISNRYTGAPTEVISDEEFSERFGGNVEAG
jgi:hypothetical protein